MLDSGRIGRGCDPRTESWLVEIQYRTSNRGGVIEMERCERLG
jgi:hypothetical protein